jgi:4'-phosphopantetheinyl transferase
MNVSTFPSASAPDDTRLEPGACHVWWGRPDDARPALERLLDRGEWGRLTAFRRPADRARFLVGCATLRLAAARHLGLPPGDVVVDRACGRCGRPHGKPRLRNNPLGIEFSVSHAGDRVAVACAVGTPVGLDVERVDAGLRFEELRVALAPDEAAALGGAGAPALLAVWTRKEAVVKALGQGFAVPPGSFAVSLPGDPPRLVSWPRDPDLPRRVWLVDLPAGPGHVACLAAVGRIGQVRAVDASAAIAAWCDTG